MFKGRMTHVVVGKVVTSAVLRMKFPVGHEA